MTSSSPRAASQYNAVLFVNENSVGPVMLPEKKRREFIEEFNATYAKIGMTIESIVEDAYEGRLNTKIPGDPN